MRELELAVTTEVRFGEWEAGAHPSVNFASDDCVLRIGDSRFSFSYRGERGHVTGRTRRASIRSLIILLAAIGCLVAVAPAAASAPPKADIVFILDESGSMGDEIADVRAQINAVAAGVAAKADARYALVGFGGGYPDAPPNEPRTRTDFTDARGLSRALEGSGAFPGGGGGREMGLHATT